MTTFLIWGAGGHGKVVADVIRAGGHRVAGFVDSDPEKFGCTVEPGGSRVVALEASFLSSLRANLGLPAGIEAIALAVGDNRRRLCCLGELGGLPVPVIMHPSAVVSPSARIGAGTVVFPGAVINADAEIGEAVIVNTGAIVEHDCWIADGVHLSPRATLAGAVRVGSRSWVGAGATVIQRITIGVDAIVGAGATVVRDVAAGATVVGVPARPLNRGGAV